MIMRYMTEKEFGTFFDKKVEELTCAGLLKSAESHNIENFKKHLVDTAKIAKDTANKIINNHPTFAAKLDVNILEAAGFFHDITKLWKGRPYHEIDAAKFVIDCGDGLIVRDGTASERRFALIKIARIILSDFILYEELNRQSYLNESHYPQHFENAQKDIQFLMRKFSEIFNTKLSFLDVVLPYKIDQQILLYADLTNVNGNRLTVEERIADIIARWPDSIKPLIEQAKPRLFVVAHTVQQLLVEV
jgi:hypothetical protein